MSALFLESVPLKRPLKVRVPDCPEASSVRRIVRLKADSRKLLGWPVGAVLMVRMLVATMSDERVAWPIGSSVSLRVLLPKASALTTSAGARDQLYDQGTNSARAGPPSKTRARAAANDGLIREAPPFSLTGPMATDCVGKRRPFLEAKRVPSEKTWKYQHILGGAGRPAIGFCPVRSDPGPRPASGERPGP